MTMAAVVGDQGKPAARRTVRAILLGALVVVGGALTAGAWVVASPTGGSPDDVLHQTSILCPEPVGHFCTILGYVDDGKTQPIVEVPARIEQTSCYAFQPATSAACLNEVPADAIGRSSMVNVGAYPGVYYRIMHVFASSDPSRLGAMDLMVRSANALIAALFFGVLGWLLPWSMKRLLVYVMLGFSVPLAVYFVTSINPTAWAIISVPAAWFAMTGLFATRSGGVPRWRRIVLAAVAVAASLLAAAARADAATYCFVAVLAVGAAHLPEMRPSRWRSNRLIWLTMILVSVIGIVGTFGGYQSAGLVGMAGSNPGDLRLLVYNIAEVPGLIAGFWTGQLGWLDAPMAPTTTVLSLAVGAGLLFGGLRRMSWTKAVAAAGVTILIVALPLFTLQMSSYTVGLGIQPRYLAPLILILAAVLISRRQKDGAPRLSLVQTALAWVFLVASQSWALHEIIRRYVSGVDGPALDLNKQVEWWRAGLPSPMAVWLIGSLGFACLALLFFIVRGRRSVGSRSSARDVSDE